MRYHAFEWCHFRVARVFVGLAWAKECCNRRLLFLLERLVLALHSSLLSVWVHIFLHSIVSLTGFLDELDVLLRTGTLSILFIVLTCAFALLFPLCQKLVVFLF